MKCPECNYNNFKILASKYIFCSNPKCVKNRDGLPLFEIVKTDNPMMFKPQDEESEDGRKINKD